MLGNRLVCPYQVTNKSKFSTKLISNRPYGSHFQSRSMWRIPFGQTLSEPNEREEEKEESAQVVSYINHTMSWNFMKFMTTWKTASRMRWQRHKNTNDADEKKTTTYATNEIALLHFIIKMLKLHVLFFSVVGVWEYLSILDWFSALSLIVIVFAKCL